MRGVPINYIHEVQQIALILSMTNGMKFNKTNCWIPHVGQSNARHKYKLGEECLGRALGVLMCSSSVSQQDVPGLPRGHKPCPGGIKQGSTVGQRGDHPLCSALMQPHLECWQHFGAPPLQRCGKVLQ